MNKRQRQVQQSLLNSELEVIKELEKSYQKAIDDINRVITSLLARKDTENLQAIIYQVKYQNALKKELEAFLNVLHTRNYQLIELVNQYKCSMPDNVRKYCEKLCKVLTNGKVE